MGEIVILLPRFEITAYWVAFQSKEIVGFIRSRGITIYCWMSELEEKLDYSLKLFVLKYYKLLSQGRAGRDSVISECSLHVLLIKKEYSLLC